MPFRKRNVMRRRPRRGRKAKGRPFTKPKTNSLYRNKIPRMLQVATRRHKSQFLRFVSNQTYLLAPTLSGGVAKPICLSIRANSIYDIMQNPGVADEVISQVPTAYGPGVDNVVADGYTEWTNRYQHFTVFGSKISVTCQPYGNVKGTPGLVVLNLSGVAGGVSNVTTAGQLNILPYTKRGQLYNNGANSTGSRLYNTYSTKKYEGVKDVDDNSQLRGRFGNDFGSPGPPGEQSFHNLWIGPVLPTATEALSPQVLRLKVEYIVKLSEPTFKNQVQA